MFFRAKYIVRDFGLREPPEILEIKKTGPPPVNLFLRPIKEEEIKPFYEKEDWVAFVVTEDAVSEKVASQCEKDEGEPTQAVKDISIRVGHLMTSFFSEFLRAARWRNGIYGHHQLIRCSEEGLLCSQDGTVWKPMRGKISIHFGGLEVKGVPYKDQQFDQIREIILTEDYEPVGHELLREAWNLRNNSPRSALILGVSALEVGVKAFVANQVPSSEWLCFEMPAPSVVKMLEEYIPSLPVRLKTNGKVIIPKKILESLKQAVAKRNRVAHKGDKVDNDESLADILTNIQMALYFLDYYAGHVWAVENIRDSEIHDFLLNEFKQGG